MDFSDNSFSQTILVPITSKNTPLMAIITITQWEDNLTMSMKTTQE